MSSVVRPISPPPHPRYLDARVPAIFWAGGIFRDSLHTVFGDERDGKTSTVARLLALASQGRALPHHDEPGPRIEKVVWLAGDHPSETLAKCYAAGLAPGSIYLTPNARGEGPLVLSEPAHLAGLREIVADERADVLVIESPETCLRPGQDENSGPVVKFQVMTPLAKLALEEKLIIIIIKHSNKAVMAPAAAKYAGSRQWSASARALLRVLRTEDGRRYFGALNQANGVVLPAVEFSISGVPDGHGQQVGRADFGAVTDRPIAQIDAGSGGQVGRERKRSSGADLIRGAFWRRATIAGDELEELRITHGISERTWRRARDEVGLTYLGTQGWAWRENPCT